MGMRFIFIALLIAGVLAVSGCSRQGDAPLRPDSRPTASEDATAQAQAALESFFAAWRSKDVTAVESHLAEYRHGSTWYFDRLDQVEFGPATPDSSWIREYMSNGTGSSTRGKADDIRCFRADATFYYKDRNEGPSPHGEPMGWHWFLERDDKDRWLVTDWGY
jgi:hypothetical protein